MKTRSGRIKNELKIEHDFVERRNIPQIPVKVNSYDYTQIYRNINYSLETINENGCVAICINSSFYDTSNKMITKFELRVYKGSNVEYISIKRNAVSYTCSSIFLNENYVVLLLEDNSEIKYYARGEEIPCRHFIQLYDLKKLDSIKLETMLQTRMVNIVNSFINEEKIYFITQTHQFVHI
jgi:hypothetical protein